MKDFSHRIATLEDIPAIEKLMELSINQLLGPLLTKEELEASFDSMGLDDQLINDGTYFMVFCDEVSYWLRWLEQQRNTFWRQSYP